MQHAYTNRYMLYIVEKSQLFELLALSGMLMDYNWTEILKRKELFRF